MMIEEILKPNLVFCHLSGTSKKKVLENAANALYAAMPELQGSDIFENLIAREKLGSTAIGKGVAIPHCRLSTINQTIGALIKLQEPVDFSAPDDLPVDLLFVMLVPENATEEHLQTLAYLARLFEQSEFRNSLRKSKCKDDLFAVAMQFDKVA